MKRIHPVPVLLSLAACGGGAQTAPQSTPAPSADRPAPTPSAVPPTATTPALGAAAPAAQDGGGLAGTSWRLVKIRGSDDKTSVPDEPANYTLTFTADGSMAARIDCNRGRATWTSAEPDSCVSARWR